MESITAALLISVKIWSCSGKNCVPTSVTLMIYVKYLYANLLKKLLEKAGEKEASAGDGNAFKDYLDQLFSENSLSGIHNFMLSLAGKLIPSAVSENKSSSEQKRVIRSVMEIVEKRYQEDISLQSIAEEVYLSPSYLSYLFKKEVGVSD